MWWEEEEESLCGHIYNVQNAFNPPWGSSGHGLTLAAGDQLQILASALWLRVQIGESAYLCMFWWCAYLEETNASAGVTCKLHRKVLPQQVLNLGPCSQSNKMLLNMHLVLLSLTVHCVHSFVVCDCCICMFVLCLMFEQCLCCHLGLATVEKEILMSVRFLPGWRKNVYPQI